MPVLIYKIERLRLGPDQGRRTTRYFIRPGRVRGPWKFFRPDEVPPFEGETAWFEIERKGASWRFIREVEGRFGTPASPEGA